MAIRIAAAIAPMAITAATADLSIPPVRRSYFLMSAALLIGDDFLRRIDFFTGILSSLVKPLDPRSSRQTRCPNDDDAR
jgi:hypothetical protein